jgi:hypothetical protein
MPKNANRMPKNVNLPFYPKSTQQSISNFQNGKPKQRFPKSKTLFWRVKEVSLKRTIKWQI